MHAPLAIQISFTIWFSLLPQINQKLQIDSASKIDATPRNVIWRDQASCGRNTAYIFLKILGNENVTYQETCQHLSKNSVGVSMKDLRNYLNSEGLAINVVKSSPNAFDSLSLPAIVYMEPMVDTDQAIGHYNILLSVNENRITYLDGTSASISETNRESFFADWSGYAIVQTNESWKLTSNLVFAACVIFAIWQFCLLVSNIWKRNRKAIVTASAVSVAIYITLTPNFLPANDLGRKIASSLRERDGKIKNVQVSYLRRDFLSLDQANKKEAWTQKTEFLLFNDCRYFKRHQLTKGKWRLTDERYFDGKNYLSRGGGVVELHSLKSVLKSSGSRFDSIFFSVSGFNLVDPLSPESVRVQRKKECIYGLIESKKIEIKDLGDQVYIFCKSDTGSSYSSEYWFSKKFDLSPIRRVAYIGQEKISETEIYDYKTIDGLQIPHGVTFTRFNKAGEVTDGFEIKLQKHVPIDSFDAEFSLPSGTSVADFTESEDGNVNIRVVGTTTAQLNRATLAVMKKVNPKRLAATNLSFAILTTCCTVFGVACRMLLRFFK